MKKYFIVFTLLLVSVSAFTQHTSNLNASQWVDSVFKTLSEDQQIAQLMVVRLSSIDPATKKITFYDQEVEEAVKKYNIGGICLFQGGPITQANFINHFQTISQTPILICIDAENGVGMRIGQCNATSPANDAGSCSKSGSDLSIWKDCGRTMPENGNPGELCTRRRYQ